MKILDGKKCSRELLKNYKEEDITLAIIRNIDQADDSFVKSIIKTCKMTNIAVKIYEDEVYRMKNLINTLNEDKKITGILITHEVMHFDELIHLISKDKDVEGLTKDNLYDLYTGKENIIPCTPKGIIKLLEYYEIDLEGKNIVVIGRSIIAGKPLALALTNRNATVTLCHSKTNNLKDITKRADIIISLAGIPNFINKNMVKDNFIGIDGGISNINGNIVGDFDFESVKDRAEYITKVPGGIGPMTNAMIIDNLIKLKHTRRNRNRN